ncbi:SAM-dependent methyltransferase [Glycomyces sp. TRM65418]|uniref:SAM-dependent methyltransferase n=1 Tax=Glycomyces sp. TRM65418 TaxID=2867006 RepID=UPI001CE61707|nr:SAM-dependent methyltransferase [Glycomyces sp. TRM65418]MCC3765976.1 SAM-dependent methyltransferase [Glycomyces sp. TRM65418]QZD55556.1 SAM-dependent methyltransferase [Glycomyces sp. TRM65418]
MAENDGITPEATADYVPDFDISKPSIARVYDATLGGKDNFAVDREGAAMIAKYVPKIREASLDNRLGLIKGVRYVAQQGIDQFLDIGAGLPTMENTHQVAQAVNPNAKVCYVDNDPIVLSHGRALLADNESTVIVTADLRHPPSILNHPDVNKMIDFDRPVGLMIVGLMMHFHPDEEPGNWIRALLEACPSGSYLHITDFADTGYPEQKAMETSCIQALGNGWARTPEEIEAHFQGLPLVPPGLEFPTRWFPGEPDREVPAVEDLEPHQRIIMAGLAYKE